MSEKEQLEKLNEFLTKQAKDNLEERRKVAQQLSELQRQIEQARKQTPRQRMLDDYKKNPENYMVCPRCFKVKHIFDSCPCAWRTPTWPPQRFKITNFAT